MARRVFLAVSEQADRDRVVALILRRKRDIRSIIAFCTKSCVFVVRSSTRRYTIHKPGEILVGIRMWGTN